MIERSRHVRYRNSIGKNAGRQTIHQRELVLHPRRDTSIAPGYDASASPASGATTVGWTVCHNSCPPKGTWSAPHSDVKTRMSPQVIPSPPTIAKGYRHAPDRSMYALSRGAASVSIEMGSCGPMGPDLRGPAADPRRDSKVRYRHVPDSYPVKMHRVHDTKENSLSEPE